MINDSLRDDLCESKRCFFLLGILTYGPRLRDRLCTLSTFVP